MHAVNIMYIPSLNNTMLSVLHPFALVLTLPAPLPSLYGCGRQKHPAIAVQACSSKSKSV